MMIEVGFNEDNQPAMNNTTKTNDLNTAIRSSFDNAKRLLDDAGCLLENKCFPSSYALAILAQEEFAKTFLLYLVQDGSIPWNENVRRSLRDHTCKQLLGTIMEFIDAEWEKYLQTLKLTTKAKFPQTIADALNILRHEKLLPEPREYATRWTGFDDLPCDRTARLIADGKIDKQKQNAIYVDIGRTGQVKSTPISCTETTATTEVEKTIRFKRIFNPFGDKITVPRGIEYSKISDAFKMLFQVITIEEYEKRWS